MAYANLARKSLRTYTNTHIAVYDERVYTQLIRAGKIEQSMKNAMAQHEFWTVSRCIAPSLQPSLQLAVSSTNFIEINYLTFQVKYNSAPITKKVIDACPNMKMISMLATGYNVVDYVYAKEKGIPVTNVPTYGTASYIIHIKPAQVIHKNTPFVLF